MTFEHFETPPSEGFFISHTFMKKIEHIGIAVKDLKQQMKLMLSFSTHPLYKLETVESEAVSTSFFNWRHQN